MLAKLKLKDFEELYHYTKNNQDEMTQDHAVNILINCCNICIEFSEETKSVNFLKRIMEIAYKLISSLNEKQLIHYIQAIYHIVKFLTEKNLYDIIIETENILWPPFLPPVLSPKLINIYVNMSKVLTNVIARSVKEDLKESVVNDAKSLLRINEISRKICSEVSDPLSYLTQSLSSFTNLTKLKIPPEQYKDHFIYILKQIEAKVNNYNVLELYHPLLTLSALVVHYTLLNSKFNLVDDFLQEMKNIAVNIFGNHLLIKNLYDLLGLPLILLPSDQEKNKKMSKCNYLLEIFVKSEVKQHRQELGTKLRMLMVTITNFYKSVGSMKWVIIPQEMQIQMFKCIYSISELESQAFIKCSCGCSVVLNSYQSLKTYQIIITFVEISLSHSSDLSSFYYENILIIIEKFLEKIIYLRNHQCKNWKIGWSTLGTGLYNLAVQLYKKKNVNALRYFKAFIKNYINFENKNEENTIKENVLSSSLQAVCSLTSKDYRKCMAFCALGVFFCEKQREYFMSIWIATKHSLKGQNDEIQLVTIAQGFKEFSTELSVVIDTSGFLKTQDVINLLTFELEQYKLKWKSKIPMMTVLKELNNLLNDIEKIVQIIANIFGDSDLIFHESILEISKTTLKKIEENPETLIHNSNSDLVLSVIYFLNYKFFMKEAILKQADEVDQNLRIVPIKLTTYSKVDPNDECDIVSIYENLKLDKYLENIKYLNSSLTLIEKHLSEIVKNGDNYGIHNILMHITFEFRLIGNRIEIIKAQNLALKIAQSKNEPLKVIESISFLIEHSDVTREYIKQLISTADEAVKIIGKNRCTTKILLIYYVCKAKAFLYENPKESFENFMIAQNILNADNSGDFGYIRNQLLFLKLKYISMPCDVLTNLHNENLLEIFVNIPGFYKDFKQTSDNAYEMETALETSQAIAEFYRCMKCPREMRYYCKEMALLTQKLMLPIRCCIYLMYLAQADLYSKRLYDCRVKLNGIADILCFKRLCEDTYKDLESNFDFDLDCIIKDMKEMNLDFHKNKSKNVSTSPVFSREISNVPVFCGHEKICNSCFWCECFEYRDLVLKKIHLEAMINIKQNDFSTANKLFDSGLNLYHLYCQETYSNNSNIKFHSDLIPQKTKEFVQSYGFLLLDFAKLLMNVNKMTSAKIVNEKLLKLLEPFKIKYMYLHQDALMQKLALLSDNIMESEIPVTSSEENSYENIKTPERNHNKVSVLIKTISPCSPIVKIPLKTRLKFELSPEDNSHKRIEPIAIKKESSKSSKEPSTCKREYKNSRKDLTKTPAPKIKIYTEDAGEASANKGRAIKANVETKKVGQIVKKKETELQDIPHATNEVRRNVRRKCSSRKNLLGELTVQKFK